MVERRCAVPGCAMSSKKLFVHCFPGDIDMREKWEKFIKKMFPKFEYEDSAQLGICSQHFCFTDFANPREYMRGQSKTLFLNIDAVPTNYEASNDTLLGLVGCRKDAMPPKVVKQKARQTQNSIRLEQVLLPKIPHGAEFKMTARRVSLKRHAKNLVKSGVAKVPRTGLLPESVPVGTLVPDVAKVTATCDKHSKSAGLDACSSRYFRRAMKNLYAMQKRGEYCDLALCLETPTDVKRFMVHRNVFETMSEKVRRTEGNEIFLKHTTLFNLKKITQFVYTGMMSDMNKLTKSRVISMCIAAFDLGITSCVKYLRRLHGGLDLSNDSLSALCKYATDYSAFNGVPDDAVKSGKDDVEGAGGNTEGKEKIVEDGEGIEYIHIESDSDTTDTSDDDG